jgi:hypothetical protein
MSLAPGSYRGRVGRGCEHLYENPGRPIAGSAAYVSEGVCPTCKLPLQRQEDWGHCDCCGDDWQVSNDRITGRLNIEVPRFFSYDKRVSEQVRIGITIPVDP